MESNAEMLAEEWVKAGVEVVVVTRTQADTQIAKPRSFLYPIIRNPGPAEFLGLVSKVDVVVQNGLSLRGMWPLLLARKPVVVRHGIYYDFSSDKLAIFKKAVMRFTVNVANCEAVASKLSARSTVIYNPYDDQIFHPRYDVERNRDLIFVGRLVTDKGLDLLLNALIYLKKRGLEPALTVIGDGPERAKLESQGRILGLSAQVTFVGRKERSDIAGLLCEHKVMVVPSRHEPFGNVAVEGIACGCAVIASSVGGLSEAIGSCGLTFTNGDSNQLAEKIRICLADDNMRSGLIANSAVHLSGLKAAHVASRYLEVIQKAINRSGKIQFPVPK